MLRNIKLYLIVGFLFSSLVIFLPMCSTNSTKKEKFCKIESYRIIDNYPNNMLPEIRYEYTTSCGTIFSSTKKLNIGDSVTTKVILWKN